MIFTTINVIASRWIRGPAVIDLIPVHTFLNSEQINYQLLILFRIYSWRIMSRNCNNLCAPPQPPYCLPACSTPCPIICCTPPVSYPCMPYVPRVQCKIACRPPTPKATKTVVYLPPCSNCPMSNPPKLEVTYLPPSPPPPPSCFYVCKTDCVPCIPPCPKPAAIRPSSCRMLCPPCPPC